MHARMVRTKGSPDQIPKAKEVLEGKVVPAVQQFPGFQGAYWLVNRDTGEALGYFFYGTKDDLDATRERGAQLRDAVVAEIGSEMTGVEEFEIIVDTGKKIHHAATHARLAEFEAEPARIDEAVKMLEEFVLPSARKLPGFQGGVWMLDRITGKGIGLTLYDSAANIAASRQAAEAIRQQSQSSAPVRVSDFREFEILSRAETPAVSGVG